MSFVYSGTKLFSRPCEDNIWTYQTGNNRRLEKINEKLCNFLSAPSSITVIKSRRMKRADEKFMHFRRTASKKKHLTELGRGDRIEKCILQKNECVDLIYLVRIRTCEGRGYEQLDFLRDGELWD